MIKFLFFLTGFTIVLLHTYMFFSKTMSNIFAWWEMLGMDLGMVPVLISVVFIFDMFSVLIRGKHALINRISDTLVILIGTAWLLNGVFIATWVKAGIMSQAVIGILCVSYLFLKYRILRPARASL